MGVYIEGMEMPKTCRDCEYCWARKDMKSCDAKYGLPISNDRWGIERASFCPLTEVPEPHGRLIDGDKAVKDYHDYEISHPYDAFDLADIMAESPTVIERSK